MLCIAHVVSYYGVDIVVLGFWIELSAKENSYIHSTNLNALCILQGVVVIE